MRKHPYFTLSASTILALSASTVLVLAQGDHPRNNTASPQAPLAATVTNQGACAAGADTRTDILTPPDDSTSDNLPAGAISLVKTCDGITIGTFSAEVTTTNAGAFIHIDMVANCTATAGQSNPCTVGQTVSALPGHT